MHDAKTTHKARGYTKGGIHEDDLKEGKKP